MRWFYYQRKVDFKCSSLHVRHFTLIIVSDDLFKNIWLMSCLSIFGMKTKARVGSKNNIDGGLMVDIFESYPHKNFNKHSLDYDFALFHLIKPLQFSDKVKPIALPSANDELPEGTLCQLSGWGMTFNDSEPAEYLRKMSHPIMNQRECAEDVKNVLELTPRMVCAGPKGDGKSGKEMFQIHILIKCYRLRTIESIV